MKNYWLDRAVKAVKTGKISTRVQWGKVLKESTWLGDLLRKATKKPTRRK